MIKVIWLDGNITYFKVDADEPLEISTRIICYKSDGQLRMINTDHVKFIIHSLVSENDFKKLGEIPFLEYK